jgi:hypothetical protein
MKNFLITLLTGFLLMACSSGKVTTIEKEVPIEIVKTEYVSVVKYDSIYVQDTSDRYVSNDTVYIKETKNLYKYKYLTDTIIKNDSIQVPVYVNTTVTETKEVNNLYWWQKFLMCLGLAGLAIGLFKFYKYLKSKNLW